MVTPSRSLLLLLAMACLALARSAAAEDAQWSVRVWAAESVSDRQVLGLAQTEDGFLWAATRDGLARFDGVKFAEVAVTELGLEPEARLRAMQRARDGSLWLATTDGRVLHLADRRIELLREGLPDGWVETIVEDGEGAIWITYRFGAVARIKDKSVSRFAENESLPGGNIALGCDRDGTIWAAQRGVISRFRHQRFEKVAELANATTRLTGARDGGMWVFNGRALHRVAADGSGREMAEHTSGAATVLFEDRAGAVWIGTNAGGLARFDSQGLVRIPTSSREITDIAEDREGSIWIATKGGGLNQIRRRAVAIEGAVAGMPYESVQSLCEDPAGDVWGVTRDGKFVRRAGGAWTPVEASPPLGTATVVAADPSGAIWIGTRSNQLHRWSGGQVATWRPADGLASHSINAMHLDRKGTLWFGGSSPNSLQSLADGRIRSFPIPRQPLGVTALTEDGAGTIWAGTVEGAILRVAADRLVEETAFVPEPGGRSHPILGLHTTPDGTVWIAYYGGGLGRIKAGRYACIRAAQGLQDDSLAAIVDDGLGWLWCGGAGGIFKVRLQELGDVAEGRRGRIQSVQYGADEALPALLATRTEAGGGLRTRDGRIWIPMGNVLVVATPALARDELPPAPAIVTQVRVDEQVRASYRGMLPALASGPPRTFDFAEPGPLRLAPAEQKIEFEFAGLSFAAPANVNFRYRLQGFDGRWIEGGVRRTAQYPRLPPGDYRFEVQACNSAGQWNGPLATLAFNVEPLFWQTHAFQVAMLAAFTLAVIWAVRIVSHRGLRRNVRVLEEQAALERERARIARDIHDDVGNRMTQILLLTGLAQRDAHQPEKTAEHLRQISASAAEVTDALDEIVWAVNPRNDTLQHLIDYLGHFAIEFLRPAGVRCRLDFPPALSNRPVPADIRHSFFLVTKEVLTNVAQHAGATDVHFQVAVTDDHVTATISDNGRGFAGDPSDPSADGLRNIRTRMQEIGGHCTIESSPNRGTRISYGFRWPASVL